jgi:hypothetical protein
VSASNGGRRRSPSRSATRRVHDRRRRCGLRQSGRNGDEYVVGRDWNHGVEAATAASGIAAGSGEVVIVNEGTVDVTSTRRSIQIHSHPHPHLRLMISNATAVVPRREAAPTLSTTPGPSPWGQSTPSTATGGIPSRIPTTTPMPRWGPSPIPSPGALPGDGDAELGDSWVDRRFRRIPRFWIRADSGAGRECPHRCWYNRRCGYAQEAGQPGNRGKQRAVTAWLGGQRAGLRPWG